MTHDGVRYISVDEWVAIVARALSVDRSAVRRAAKLDLVGSALASPLAGFGSTEVYPTLADKAAVLCHRLVKNHALPDGNKRTAFVVMVTFLKRNGCTWIAPDDDDLVDVMVGVASDRVSLDELVDWVRQHIR